MMISPKVLSLLRGSRGTVAIRLLPLIGALVLVVMVLTFVLQIGPDTLAVDETQIGPIGELAGTGPTPIFEGTGTPLPTIDKADPASPKIAGGEPRMFFRTFGNGSTCAYQIRLKGVFKNGGNFDWVYEVQDLGGGGGCGLSHTVFSLCQPNAFDAYVDADPSDTIALAKPDPTTGLTGVKFDELSETEDFESGNFTYTLSNNFSGAVSDILVAF